jgi:hypothetical protein
MKRQIHEAAIFPALALSAGVFLCLGATLAADNGLPPLNSSVAAFAREKLGQQVGNGECTSLAVEALAHAGARKTPENPGDGNYVWGDPIASFREALPGDVVQFRDAVFRGRRPLSGRRWESWHQEYPHHTAIVSGIRDQGRVVTILHQNISKKGAAEDRTKLVSESTIRPESLQKGGKVWIYRPVPFGRTSPRPDDSPAGDPR